MRNIVRYFDGGLPVNRCNLRCSYCYVTQDQGIGWGRQEENLLYSVEHMRKALAVERLGGNCMFNFVASGETLLFDMVPDLVEMITSLGHYARIVTNGTVREPLQTLAALPERCRERLTIKFSMHYLALKERNLLDKFCANVAYIREAGISYSVELCASDEFIPHIKEIKSLCEEQFGALPHVVELRDQGRPGFPRLTKLPLEEYREIWNSFESPLFRYETRDYETYQSKFCYGGDYGITFSWKTGEASQCSCPGNKKIFNLFENPETPLRFAAVGKNCPAAHCYTNYLWGPLAGNFSDSDIPTYAEERDRITKDGSHWLTPAIREVYSRRCADFHTPYSKTKTFYIDQVMRKVYRGLDPTEEECRQLVQIVTAYLSRNNYQSAAIYGMGGLGQWLLHLLSAANVPVKYGIDIKGSAIKSRIPVYLPEAPLPAADVIIVSVYYEFNHIMPRLREISGVDVISLLELADMETVKQLDGQEDAYNL